MPSQSPREYVTIAPIRGKVVRSDQGTARTQDYQCLNISMGIPDLDQRKVDLDLMDLDRLDLDGTDLDPTSRHKSMSGQITGSNQTISARTEILRRRHLGNRGVLGSFM
ncbi:unnamed protein product [Phytophthora fragariaefolia]|uniref:Unnamed protein product n=1 Tax=Phytophthora fragariaefolia TaxID=1490495 RepID=A0A9W6Y974_9STRA|nr:unnamed protein product [Phytophthora fragariaefolia]